MHVTKATKATGSAFRPGRVALGLAAFIALAALGAWAAGWFEGGWSGLLSVSRAMPVGLLLTALALLLVDFLLGGLRLHLWLRLLEPKVSYWLSFKTYLINLFAAAISPMAVASGPAQLAALMRGGVRPAPAVAGLLLMYVAILSSLLFVGGLGGTYLLLTTDLAAGFGGFQRSLLVGSVLAATFLVIAILNPRGGDLIAHALKSAASRLAGWPARFLFKLSAKLEHAISEYRAALRAVRQDWKVTLAACFGTTTAMWLNKCAIGFVVAIALGYAGGYLDVAARQALQYLFLYFSPSPGQSGLAEASVPIFMVGIIPEGRWFEFAILWRGLTSYIGVVVGALVAVLMFGPLASRRASGDQAAENGESELSSSSSHPLSQVGS